MNLSLVFSSPEEQACILYHKHFRELAGTTVVKQDVMEGEDTLVLPLPSSFGIFSPKSFLNEIVIHLGKQVQLDMVNYIVRKYAGEQPVGSAFIIKIPPNSTPTPTRFRFLVVVSLFRAVTCRGDNYAWLDPRYVPLDFAYTAMRGVLLKILQHNAVSKTPIKIVYFPDFWKVRTEAPGGELVTPTQADDAVSQMVLAVQSFINPSPKPRDWIHAIVLTSQIVKSRKEDLIELLNSGVLEERGLYNFDELDMCITWARDGKDQKRQEAAIHVLAACLHRRDSQFTVPKHEVAKRIAQRETGCMLMVLSMVLQNKIVVHQELDQSEITFGTVIGVGSRGTVYRGMCRNQHVAIKKFNSDSQLDVFKQELSIMCLVQHPNLVQCYGGVTVNGWIIVEELMQVNLSTVLANPNIQMDLGIMINIALGISKGLSFLHLHCQLIHRDLKSYNVLINTYEGLQVKITDFGISKIVSQSQMTANVGTIAWIAPEVFGQKGYNQKADIYSLAIVMWELTTREIPFSNLASFAIPLCVIRGERPPLPKDINPTWKKLITDCWQKNPKRRPNITSVLSSLKKLHESLPPSTKSLNKLNVLEVLQTETRNELVTKQLSQKSSPVDLNFRVSTPPTSMLIQQANSEEDDDKEEQSTEIVTCSVPTIWASPVLNLETKINQYFSNLNSSSRKGTIEIFSKRFLLLPHSTLSGLLKSVQTHFQFNVNDDAIYFASHIQYTMGQLFATNVALSFFSIQPSTDPLSRVISCCIYSAFLGIGFVEISDLSTFKNGNFDVLITHFTFILAEGEHQAKTDPKFFVCGWLSGWCNIASSSPRETFHVHTKKISTTKVIYTFLTAHPQQIAKEIKEFRKTDAIETSKEKISAIILNQRLQDARSGVLEDSLGSGDVTNSSPRGTTPTKKDWFSHSLLEITRINNPFTSKDFHSIKSFSGKALTPAEIKEKAVLRLNQLIIDPTTATVGRFQTEKCILMPSDIFGKLANFFESSAQSSQHLEAYSVDAVRCMVQRLLYFFSESIGRHACKTFCEKLEIGKNPISWLLALSSYLGSHGWSSLHFDSAIDPAIFKRKNFHILCRSRNSFEARHKDNVSTPIKQRMGLSCCMHSGFIAGWFEACFNVSVMVIESKCMKRGDLSCEFIISPPEYIANHIPKNVIPIFPVIPSVSLPTPSKEEIEAPQRLKLSERKNRSISERLPPGQIWDEKVAIPQENTRTKGLSQREGSKRQDSRHKFITSSSSNALHDDLRKSRSDVSPKTRPLELSTQQFGVYSQSSRQYKFGRVPFGPRPEATTKDPRPSLHTPELRVPILDGINEIPHTSPRQTTTLPAANPRYFNHNHSPQNSPYRPASPRHSPLHSPRHSPRLNNSPRGEHSPHNKNKAPKSPRLNSSPRHPLPTPESTKKSTPPSETTPIRRSKTEGYKDRPLRSSANDHQIKRPKSSKSQKLTTQETTQINNHVREPLPAKPRVRSQPRESREPREPRQHTPEPAAHADFIKESSKHKKRDSNDFITETKPRGSAEIKKESKHKHNSENNTPSKTQQETESQPRPKSPPRLRTHHHNNNHEAEQTKRVTSRHHDTPRTEAPRIDGPRKIKSQASIGPPKESNDELAKRHSIAIEKPKRDLANRKSRRPKSDMIPSTPTFDSTVDATPEPRALKHRGSPSTSRKPRNTSTPDIQPIEQPQKANKRDQS